MGFPNKVIHINYYEDGFLDESYNESVSAQKVLFKFGVNYKFGGY